MPKKPRQVKRGTKLASAPVVEIEETQLGPPIEYVVCPLCGRNRVMELSSERSAAKNKLGRIDWNFFDPETSAFIQIRAGGGRGSGFHLIESLTWPQASGQLKYAALIEDIKAQIKVISKLR